MADKKVIEISESGLQKGIMAVLLFLVVAAIFTGGFGYRRQTDKKKDSSKTAKLDDFAVFSDSAIFPKLGPDNAKHTVIEFSDFQCPFCALASGLPGWAQKKKNKYGGLFGISRKIEKLARAGKIKFIYAPMTFLGPESVYAAQAGICANNQDKFWEMHDLIFIAHTEKENSGKYEKRKLELMAKKIKGIDAAKFSSCLESDETLASVQKAANIARKFTNSTPTFYVDGKKVVSSWSEISPLLE